VIWAAGADGVAAAATGGVWLTVGGVAGVCKTGDAGAEDSDAADSDADDTGGGTVEAGVGLGGPDAGRGASARFSWCLPPCDRRSFFDGPGGPCSSIGVQSRFGRAR
jgi:hypothetical protein